MHHEARCPRIILTHGVYHMPSGCNILWTLSSLHNNAVHAYRKDNSCVTRRRKSEPSNTQDQTKRARRQALEADDYCNRQCGANDTKSNHTTMNPHRKSSNPTHSQVIAKSSKSTNISIMYIGMHPHAPGH